MPDADARRSLPGAALRSRDYRLFQLARFSTVLAVQTLSVSVGWQVYDLTRRPLDLGFVGLAQFLPAFLLALPAGQLADRVDRRRILAAVQLSLALLAGGMVAFSRAGVTDVRVVYGILVLFGAARGFSTPAGQALMPDLVPKEDFPDAVAWSASVWQVATIVGPALGGLVYAAGGAVTAYETAAGLFGAAFFATALIRTRSVRHEGRSEGLAGMLYGIRHVARSPVVLGALALDLFAVLLGGATALLPVYARDVLHVGPSGLGALRAAPALGAALTAIWLAYRPLGSRAGRKLFVSVAVFGVMTVVFGLSTSFLLSLAALCIMGAADLVSVVVRHTVVQLSTPNELRGRVSAVNGAFIGASNELGEFESGVTAALFGVVPAVVLGGVGTLGVVAIFAWRFPELRRIDRLDEVAGGA